MYGYTLVCYGENADAVRPSPPFCILGDSEQAGPAVETLF